MTYRATRGAPAAGARADPCWSCLEGWIDAGLGAHHGAASRCWAARHRDGLATLRRRRADRPPGPPARPAASLDGVDDGLTLAGDRAAAAARTDRPRPAVLVGPEPDMRWQPFSAAGRRPRPPSSASGWWSAWAPSRRRSPTPGRCGWSATATTPELAARGRLHAAATIDVPAGIQAGARAGVRRRRHPGGRPVGPGPPLRRGHAVPGGQRRPARQAGRARPGSQLDRTGDLPRRRPAQTCAQIDAAHRQHRGAPADGRASSRRRPTQDAGRPAASAIALGRRARRRARALPARAGQD